MTEKSERGEKMRKQFARGNSQPPTQPRGELRSREI